MKKLLPYLFFFSFISFLSSQSLFTKQWNVEITDDDGSQSPFFVRYFFGEEGQNFESQTYYPLLQSYTMDGEDGSVYGYFREEGDKIYKYITENDNEFLFYDMPVGEALYFDFGLEVGDSLISYLNNYTIVVTEVDNVELLDGSTRKAIYLQCIDSGWLNTTIWVEGIGDINHGFEGQRLLCDAPEGDWALRCYYENSELLYKGQDASDCFLVSTNQIAVEDINIVPNPVYAHFNLEGISTDFQYQIINPFGKVIQIGNSFEPFINTETLVAGTYFLQVVTDDGASTISFVKI
ncbi:MAG: T9SS type A sorting domain-containing protein [Saprospiraceae bacterium]|nr:T9SS type A sorting domain-containing protein [Saprospiraceae bacterium]